MVYDAPLVAAAIGGIEAFRRLGLWAEIKFEENGKTFPLWLHWYSWYYAFIFCLGGWALITSVTNILSVSDWLEPVATEAYANITLIPEEADSWADFNVSVLSQTPAGYALWKEEASLEGYQALRVISLLSPLWLFGTFVVSVLHTRKHVVAVQRAGGLVKSPLRDKTLRILGLPMCYGLMSYKSVIRMWQLCVDAISEGDVHGFHYFTSYSSRRNFVMEMYESNFMVGDIYEAGTAVQLHRQTVASNSCSSHSLLDSSSLLDDFDYAACSAYALAIFGHLLIEVLNQKLTSSINNAALEEGSSDTPRCRTDLQRMQKSMGSLTIAGIMLFFWTCLLQALYSLAVTFLGFWGIMDQYFSRDPADEALFQSEHIKESAKYFFLGAGFMASFAAIGNIMQVEAAFHDALKEFQPAPKFWGTKILVSLAFMQSCALSVVPPFNSWSAVRSNLLYASCLTFECFLISLSHLFAWSHDEAWYIENENEVQPAIVSTELAVEEPVEDSAHKTAGISIGPHRLTSESTEFSPLSGRERTLSADEDGERTLSADEDGERHSTMAE